MCQQLWVLYNEQMTLFTNNSVNEIHGVVVCLWILVKVILYVYIIDYCHHRKYDGIYLSSQLLHSESIPVGNRTHIYISQRTYNVYYGCSMIFTHNRVCCV